MYQRSSLPFSFAAFVFALALFSSAQFIYAESVLWNQTVNDTLCEDPRDLPGQTLTDSCHIELDNPNVSISYNARVVNADTGAIIACGSSVPAGTRARFEFIPHVYTDIDWFGTGYSNDSPYGDWVNAGGPPAQVECLQKDFVSRSLGRVGDSDVYIPLEVNPPPKSVLGLGGLSCTSEGASQTCQLNSAGIVSAVFQFADTYGKFYARSGRIDSYWAGWPYYGQCDGGNTPMYAVSSGSAFTLSVPEQTISCPITVIAVTGNPPTPPQLTSAGACVVGTPHGINFVSTDPDGDNLKYGVDWDADGSVNEWVPPGGYVASGNSQSASRTYSTSGSKTVKVMAQDEGGLSSAWATLTFSCAATVNQCSDNADNDGDGLIDSLDPDCTATGGLNESGTPPGPQAPPPTSQDAILNIRVIPSLVRTNNTTKVNWSAQNVASCSVQGQNGDSWSGLQSILGGTTSRPIVQETIYTLSCIDLEGETRTKTATVRISPVFQER